MRIDLHTHSSASDGTDPPPVLVAKARAAALDVIALTDHDTVSGWVEASTALPAGMILVRGAEISCAADGRSVHLLAYLFDPDEPEFEAERTRMVSDRVRRARAIVERLNELGVAVSYRRVEELADGGSVGRPHIARAMVELGIIEEIGAAFGPDWLARGGRAYVEKYVLEPTRAIALVHAAGGVAVLAHPGDETDAATIERWASAGLDGLEVDHPQHGAVTRARLRSLARSLELVVTGSSDYHGLNKDVRLGENLTDPEAYESLVARASGVAPVTG